MARPLNYSTKAIECFRALPLPQAPWSKLGIDYLIRKLVEAQVFILPEYGELLDRGKIRPEVPGVMFKPPFPVVAIEYAAPRDKVARSDEYWTASPCTRRISLAWDMVDDFPAAAPWHGMYQSLGPGVITASLAYYDEEQTWLPILGAIHTAYEDEWIQPDDATTSLAINMVGAGRVSSAQAKAKTLMGSIVPILPEALQGLAMRLGVASMIDHVRADCMDECNAYLDLCYALACRNVSARKFPAFKALNASRRRSGKPPLKDFHVLELDGEVMTGSGIATGPHGSPRDHLRRGHIRRLGDGRVTWVNQTMVHGRGDFVGKAYSVRGAR